MKKTKRLLSWLLCVSMVLAMMPTITVAAAEGTFSLSQLTVATEKESTLAPGVTQNAYTVYDKNGDQVKMFVTTADTSVDTVKLFASYKDMDPTNFGMSKLTEQVAAFKEKANAGDPYYQGTVVAGINASYYNMTTGRPDGIFVMNGVVGNASESAGYFAVMKDGSVKIGVKGDYANDKDNILEAIGIYTMLIVDGEICSGLNNSQKYPRQTIGITADGKVILMTADGNQAPKSIGLTMQEQAQVMLDLGCVWAGHLDGGGSCTYGAKAEGSNEFVIANSPSDGSERSISNGFIIVSTAVSDGVFKSASLTAEHDYVTPGSIVSVSAVGADKAGFSAEIPADVSWKLADSSLGTVEDGVFTSNGTVGDAVVQMVYAGSVVGETTIHVVVPDAITFDQTEMVVPFGKTVEIGITATVDNGIHIVALKASDVEFTFDNDIGTMNGFAFTAAEEGSANTSAVCTITVRGTEVSATANISLGKGSEVISDFNDGDIGRWKTEHILNFNYYFPGNNVSVVNGALRVEVDYSNSFESGYMATGLGTSETYVIENGLALGFKIFIPEECEGLRLRMCFYDANNSRKTADLLPIGKVSTLEKGAWYYVKADISAYPIAKILKDKVWLEFYVCDRDDLTNYGYNHLDYDSLNTRMVFYIDDITVDYSSAVDDREAPVFTNPTYAHEGTSDAAVLANGVTISGAAIDFAVNVKEYAANNAIGLDAASAKVYIDGNEVPAAYKNGMITVNCTLSDGKHHIKFEMADKNGNTAILTRSFTVNTGSGSAPVKLVAHDASLQNVLFGSIYYVDLVATEIENVQSVTVDLDLNNMNQWELDHMEVTDGFEATYTISRDNNVATIVITRTGDVALTGEAALISMPIRVFEMPIKPSDSEGASKPVGTVFTYASFKKVGSKGESWPVSVNIEVDKGIVTYVDNTAHFFSGEDVKVMTESRWWHNDSSTGDDYLQWNGGHDHRAETKQYYAETLTNHVDAVAMEDKAATCTEDGYTGRTFCEICNSVVDWGTTIPATGHSYGFVDGVLKCTACGDLFNGEWTDGKLYADGVVASNGWVGDSYYRDGVKLTGLQEIDGYYYDFGEDGVCANRAKADGFYYDESISAYRYFTAGILRTGEVPIYPEVYFFDANGVAISGQVDVLGYTCYFTEKGAFERSDDTSIIDAGFCGTNIQYVLLDNGTLKVDGDGVMQDYSSSGTYPAWVTQNDVTAITDLVVGNGITKIGKFGFYRNPYLKTVTFEENSSLETIGWGAFGHCWRLTGVTIPASVKTLDPYAFYECGAMTHVAFEENSKLTTIGYCAFRHGLELKAVYIPDTVTSIGANVFLDANPDVVLQVAENSVGHAYALGNNLKVEVRAGKVTELASGTLSETIAWTLYSNGTLEITGSGAMPNFTSQTGQPWAGLRNNIKKIVIGKDITTVGNYAFAYCQNTTALVFEKGSKVTKIGVLSFFNNPQLTEVTLPEKVTYISACGFGDCFALTSVYIPQGVTGIYKTAFRKCTEVVLNVASGSFAETFARENGINYATRDFVYTPIASGTCGDSAEWNMYENGELWITGSGAMENYTSHTEQPWASIRHTIKKIVIGKDITTVGNYAFAYCQNTTELVFEEGSQVTKIGVLSFFNNPQLTEVTLPEKVTYISACGFGDCFSLTSAYIPESVTGIYKTAFRNCTEVVLNVASGSYGEQFAVDKGIQYTVR